MIDAQTQMDQATHTARHWLLETIRRTNVELGDQIKLQEKLEGKPVIVAAQLIAAGLDELAMSNRMIAEKLGELDNLGAFGSCCCDE